jgi:hypothetical protein
MFIDLADPRDLTVYSADVVRGAPELNLLGLALLPAFGAGIMVLGWSLYRSTRQKLMVSRDLVWLQSASPFSTPVCCKRTDIERIFIRQSWVQRQLGTGDLIIHCRNLDRPLTISGLTGIRSIKRRLLRHLIRRPQACLPRPEPALTPVPVGTARPAPRLRPRQLAAA